MKVSTKGRYALRAMLELAKKYGEKRLSLKELAEAQGISPKYLEHIMSRLLKIGYIKSKRGCLGSYELEREPKEYTVWDILCRTEGPLLLAECYHADHENKCIRCNDCPASPFWMGLEKVMKEYTSKVTLADLIVSEQDGSEIQK